MKAFMVDGNGNDLGGQGRMVGLDGRIVAAATPGLLASFIACYASRTEPHPLEQAEREGSESFACTSLNLRFIKFWRQALEQTQSDDVTDEEMALMHEIPPIPPEVTELERDLFAFTLRNVVESAFVRRAARDN